MTRTISLIIGIATVALVVAVPTAFGEGRLAGSPEPAAVAPDWFERAVIKAQNEAVVVSRPDSHDTAQPVTNGYIDAARACAAHRRRRPDRAHGLVRALGASGRHPRRARSTQSAPEVTASGRSSAWDSASASCWHSGCISRCGSRGPARSHTDLGHRRPGGGRDRPERSGLGVRGVYFGAWRANRSRIAGASGGAGSTPLVRPLAKLGLAGPHTHLLTVPGRRQGRSGRRRSPS